MFRSGFYGSSAMEANGKQRLWSQKIRKIVHNDNTKKLDFSIFLFYANSKRLLKLKDIGGN